MPSQEFDQMPSGEELIELAREFAARAHGSIHQRRKYSGLPYVSHPEAVAAIVREVTDDPWTIAAAWLHDVVEDTPTTLEDIRAAFGETIARLVSDLTDVSRPADGNRAARVAIDRAHTAGADPRAKTVKLADVIHNVGEMAVQDPGYAPRYAAEKLLLLDVLKEGDPQLWIRALEVIRGILPEVAAAGPGGD